MNSRNSRLRKLAITLLVVAAILATSLRSPVPAAERQLEDSSRTSNTTSSNKEPLLPPLLFLHGIDGHASEFDAIMDWIRAEYGASAPIMHSLGLHEGKASLFTPMMDQRDQMVEYLAANSRTLGIDNGFHLIAHSQGALLARAVIQKLPDGLHPTYFVSMAAPQRGQWGPCNMDMPDFTHSAYTKTARSIGWWAFYNPLAQSRLSFAGYWNDPRYKSRFQKECNFLPAVNGYKGDMAQQRGNFLRLERAIFLGSPEDDCINPPLSSVFEFVDEHGNSSSTEQSFEYQSDAFGLKTLLDQGRLVLQQVPNQLHLSWLSPTTFQQYVLPHLLHQQDMF